MYEHTEHQWGNWYPMSIYTEDNICPDSDGHYYYYIRKCNVMGCTFVQKAERVVPEGAIKTFDPESSDGAKQSK